MNKLDKFTFLIPIFNLKDERFENFKFVLNKIKEVTDRILVVEQVRDKRKTSTAKRYAKKLGVNYLSIKIIGENMNKSVLINNATDIIDTEFVWVNDADCYLKFQEVINKISFDKDFIQPYELVKFIDEKTSSAIRSNNSCDIEFKRTNAAGNGCMYGALSFIYKRSSFIDIGRLHSRLDLYHEDTELCYRIIKSKKYEINIIFDVCGIHLYHNYDNRDARVIVNEKEMTDMHNTNINNIIDVIQDYYNKLFIKKNKIEILTMFRGDIDLLENITKFIDSNSKEIEELDITITWVCNSECSQFKKTIHENSQINKRINIHQGSDLGGHNINDYFAGDLHHKLGDIYMHYFEKSGADIIITLEDDIIPESDNAISKLLSSLIKHPGAAVVCGMYESRHVSQYLKKDGVSIGFPIGKNSPELINSIKNTGLNKMAWVGGGFTSYYMKKLKKTNTNLREVFRDANHFLLKPSHTPILVGWDIFLSNLARENGMSVLLDTSIFCDHIFN